MGEKTQQLTHNIFHVFFSFVHRFCSQKWNGSSLVLGTMYAYDIFAAMPCCPDRLTVSILNIYHYIGVLIVNKALQLNSL